MFRPIQKVGKLHGFTEYGVRTLLFPLAFLRKIYGLISKRVKSFCACTYVCGIYIFSCIAVGPSSVRLKYGKVLSLSVGKTYQIQCEAVGARPMAAISWWIDGKLVSVFSNFYQIHRH